MKNQLIQLIIVHFKEMIREPGVLFWGIVFPLIMATGLGFAFTQKPDVTKEIAVINFEEFSQSSFHKFINEHTEQAESRKGKYYQVLVSDTIFGNTTFQFSPMKKKDAIIHLKRGRVVVLLEDLNDSLAYHFDPINPEAQLLHMQLENLLKYHKQEVLKPAGNIAPLTLQGTRYVDFLIPGLIGMNIMMSCSWGLSYSIIERRKGKMLRRMIVTPMKRSNLLIGQFSARIAMNAIEVGLLILFAYLVFDIQLQGSFIALILLFLAGNIAFSGIAILVASRTSKTEVGNGMINAITMPMMLLSGIFFSYQNFPEWSIPIIKALPLTMITDSTRAIFNEGASLLTVIVPTTVLTAIGIVCSAIGLKIFKWY